MTDHVALSAVEQYAALRATADAAWAVKVAAEAT